MVNVLFSTQTLADNADNIGNAVLSQAEFFLFLADSVEQEGLLTTPLDLQQTPDALGKESLGKENLENVSLELKTSTQSDSEKTLFQKETVQAEDQR